MWQRLHTLLSRALRRPQRSFQEVLHEARFGSDPVTIRAASLERILVESGRRPGPMITPESNVKPDSFPH